MGRNSKAQGNALGEVIPREQAPPGRNNYSALTALDCTWITLPRALPWAFALRPVRGLPYRRPTVARKAYFHTRRSERPPSVALCVEMMA